MSVASFALTTLDAVKQELGGMALSGTTDDALLEGYINAASRQIIMRAQVEFRNLNTSGTRVFPVGDDGTVDLTPYSLRQVSQIRTNVEGTTPTTLDATQYQLIPVTVSDGGYRRIRVLNGYTSPSGGVAWNGTQAALGTIEITGTWGYASVPEDVERWCIVTVREWYLGGRTNRSSVVAADDSGAPTFNRSLGLPGQIKREIDENYRTPVVA